MQINWDLWSCCVVAGTKNICVIANQPSGWCGNPLWRRNAVKMRKSRCFLENLQQLFCWFPENFGDCHASVRTGSQ